MINFAGQQAIQQDYQVFHADDTNFTRRCSLLSGIQRVQNFRNGLATGVITATMENIEQGESFASLFQRDAQEFLVSETLYFLGLGANLSRNSVSIISSLIDLFTTESSLEPSQVIAELNQLFIVIEEVQGNFFCFIPFTTNRCSS